MIPGAWRTIRRTNINRISQTTRRSLFLFFFFSSNRTDNIYIYIYFFFLVYRARVIHNPPPSSSFFYPLFSPSSSLYIFLMEFHFLRVLKTFAKRRCEKKLEICVYHITKHPRGKKSHNTERGGEFYR